MYKDIAKKLCICYYLCGGAVCVFVQFIAFPMKAVSLLRAAQGESARNAKIYYQNFQKEGNRK